MMSLPKVFCADQRNMHRPFGLQSSVLMSTDGSREILKRGRGLYWRNGWGGGDTHG